MALDPQTIHVDSPTFRPLLPSRINVVEKRAYDMAHRRFKDKWEIDYGRSMLNVGNHCEIRAAKEGHIAKQNRPLSYALVKQQVTKLEQLNTYEIPNIPEIVASYISDLETTVIFPFYGYPLSHIYKYKQCLPEPVLFIADELLQTLSALESHNWVHGNIDPTNITFRDLDVRLAGGWSTATPLPIKSNFGQDTPLKMRAPELLLLLQKPLEEEYKSLSPLVAEENQDPSEYRKIDVWSLGATLFEIFTGESLFKCNDHESYFSFIHHQFNQRFGEESVQRFFTRAPVRIELLNENLQETIESLDRVEIVLQRATEDILDQYPAHQKAAAEKLCRKVSFLILQMLTINPKERPSAKEMFEELRKKPQPQPKKNASPCCTIS